MSGRTYCQVGQSGVWDSVRQDRMSGEVTPLPPPPPPSVSFVSQTCRPGDTRQRMRRVQRHPAVTTGVVRCPHLSESERCDAGVNCHSVEWAWSAWGDCVLAGGVPCGDGATRARVRGCVRLDGSPTAERDCRDVSDLVVVT